MALAVAATGAAGVQILVQHHLSINAQTLDFSTTLVRLFVSIPLMAVLLAGSRIRWHPRTTLGEQFAATVLPLAAGGLISLAGWQLASGAGLARGPGSEAVILMCGFGVLTVTVVHSASRVPSRHRGQRSRRVLVVGSGSVARRVSEEFTARGGVEFVGFVDDDPLDSSGCVGRLRELASICDREGVDHVVVAFSRSRHEDLIDALRPVQGRVAITVVPRLFDLVPATAHLHDLGVGLAGISVPPPNFGWGPRVAKRTVDLVGALGALIVLLLPMLAIAAAIRITSRGPVVFRQTRVGKNSQPFSIYKFRTMMAEPRPSEHPVFVAEPATGPFPKLKNDPRVTGIGRLLRRTSLDELPQLWNVVRGDMSLVGPRPFVPDDAVWITDWAQRRYAVRPGITGLWQVSGRNNLTFEEMCRIDNLYVSCWSSGLDLRILLRTFRAMVVRAGAY